MFAHGTFLPAITVLFAAAVLAAALVQRLVVSGPGLHLVRRQLPGVADSESSHCPCSG